LHGFAGVLSNDTGNDFSNSVGFGSGFDFSNSTSDFFSHDFTADFNMASPPAPRSSTPESSTPGHQHLQNTYLSPPLSHEKPRKERPGPSNVPLQEVEDGDEAEEDDEPFLPVDHLFSYFRSI
jgi:hypothetical protein